MKTVTHEQFLEEWSSRLAGARFEPIKVTTPKHGSVVVMDYELARRALKALEKKLVHINNPLK